MVVLDPNQAPTFEPVKPPYILVVYQGDNIFTTQLANNAYLFQPGQPMILSQDLLPEVVRINSGVETGIVYVVKKDMPMTLTQEEIRKFIGWKPKEKKEKSTPKEGLLDKAKDKAKSLVGGQKDKGKK